MERDTRYTVIYADPPWRYKQKGIHGAAEKHYPTMSMDELYRLDVESIAGQNATLFLWVTFPMIQAGLKLINAWGFQYKTVAFVWVKQNKSGKGWFFGLGFWTRGNAEICLLATRGKPKRRSAKVQQLIVSPVKSHSEKPVEARERIEELMGDVPKIELFARDRPYGWDVWGNEVSHDIELSMKAAKGGRDVE